MSAEEDGFNSTQPNQIPVCCLACGLRYRKPVSGHVTRANPGCPACGYLGWARDPEAPPADALSIEKLP
jgi:predicted  nucleic acid-binding Zn-ribbon protein